MVVQEYGSVHDVDTMGEEMGGVTDDDDAGKKGRKKGKSGLKPGQALSFTGLEKRSYTGVDMLDTKQMLPRVVGGSLVMFLTIALVALFAYHVLESGGNPAATKSSVKPPQEALKSPTMYTHHAKALKRIHTRGRVARKRHESPTSWMESIADGRPHENSVNQRRLLSLMGSAEVQFHE